MYHHPTINHDNTTLTDLAYPVTKTDGHQWTYCSTNSTRTRTMHEFLVCDTSTEHSKTDDYWATTSTTAETCVLDTGYIAVVMTTQTTRDALNTVHMWRTILIWTKPTKPGYHHVTANGTTTREIYTTTTYQDYGTTHTDNLKYLCDPF